MFSIKVRFLIIAILLSAPLSFTTSIVSAQTPDQVAPPAAAVPADVPNAKADVLNTKADVPNTKADAANAKTDAANARVDAPKKPDPARKPHTASASTWRCGVTGIFSWFQSSACSSGRVGLVLGVAY